MTSIDMRAGTIGGERAWAIRPCLAEGEVNASAAVGAVRVLVRANVCRIRRPSMFHGGVRFVRCHLARELAARNDLPHE